MGEAARTVVDYARWTKRHAEGGAAHFPRPALDFLEAYVVGFTPRAVRLAKRALELRGESRGSLGPGVRSRNGEGRCPCPSRVGPRKTRGFPDCDAEPAPDLLNHHQPHEQTGKQGHCD